jgi:hypothetical protein
MSLLTCQPSISLPSCGIGCYRPGIPMSPRAKAFFVQVLDGRFKGNKAKMAAAMGISPSAFGRQLTLGSFGPEKCLRLAKAIGESPRVVLTSSGKQELADAIEDVYQVDPSKSSATDRQLMALPEDVKEYILQIAASLVKSAPQPRGRPRGSAATKRTRAVNQ